MPNLEIYTTMVVACARNKDPLAAEEYINRMKQGTTRLVLLLLRQSCPLTLHLVM